MKVCTGCPSTVETGHGLLGALKDGFYIRENVFTSGTNKHETIVNEN
jgi:hypothetical protein